MPAAGTPGPNGPSVTYIMRAKGTDYYKIGFTRGNLERRRLTIQCGCPFPLQIVRTLEGRQHETRLHNHLRPHRLQGEWFHLPNGIEEL